MQIPLKSTILCNANLLRKITPLLVFAALGFSLLVGFSGCAGKDRYPRYSYGTSYIGPDGTIIGGEIQPVPQRGRDSRRSSSQTEVAPAPAFHWEGDGVIGAPSIVINLSEQKAYFRKGGRVVGVTEISTGREGYRTPAGNFKITQKSRDHISNLYGDFVDDYGNVVVENVGVRKDKRPPGTKFRGAPMPFFMRIHGAVGMHAGYLPGYAASHGCIRLPHEAAAKFFANAAHGTPVAVVR